MDLLVLNPVHTVIFAVSFIGVIISIIQMVRYPQRVGYMIAPLTYLVNVFLYNLVLYLKLLWNIDLMSNWWLEIWTGAVRLHSLFLFIMYVIIQPIRKSEE